MIIRFPLTEKSLSYKVKKNMTTQNKLNIVFPQGEFTVKDLFAQNAAVKAPTIRKYVSDALAQKQLKIIGFRQNGRGRPTNIYNLI